MKKLEMFKTAYSVLHKTYVSIIKIMYDDDGVAIIITLMDGQRMVFRECELTDFCL